MPEAAIVAAARLPIGRAFRGASQGPHARPILDYVPFRRHPPTATPGAPYSTP